MWTIAELHFSLNWWHYQIPKKKDWVLENLNIHVTNDRWISCYVQCLPTCGCCDVSMPGSWLSLSTILSRCGSAWPSVFALWETCCAVPIFRSVDSLPAEASMIVSIRDNHLISLAKTKWIHVLIAISVFGNGLSAINEKRTSSSREKF